MTSHVYKGVTIAGTSDQSFSHAIEAAIERAKQTIRELRWFEVKEQRGAIRDGKVEYQVSLEVFFRLLDDDSGE